jgi:hypothetical protein
VCYTFQFHLVDLVCPTIIKKMKTETAENNINNYLSHYDFIIMRGENFVAHLDSLGGTSVCCGIPVAHH